MRSKKKTTEDHLIKIKSDSLDDVKIFIGDKEIKCKPLILKKVTLSKN